MRQKGSPRTRGLAALPMERLLREAAESLGVSVRGGEWDEVHSGRPVYHFTAQGTALSFPLDGYQIEEYADSSPDQLQSLDEEVTLALVSSLRTELGL